MTVIVGLADATLHLADLIDHAASGEEIIMVKAGRPVARLAPIDQDGSILRRRNARTLQAGFNDPPSQQVQWCGNVGHQVT
ncbi:MAG TPA: type II toxin-antitoxin system prevent-host-death family antitoxin [Aliidongia sp.]|uniref:type II toxin-antitoxin system Phd/YefM family antitoxin n=1 Tax=Aliidongia sp. TaxID=1914230 RepID=UPI002DDCB673|nr:type II toxin-antitoxin system prevent-host-death family antitoxin [Aliidongia sp.]HEV2677289.1 type II toxin-antitoxin system prevent-host-death family antitoxin [Aliidongia sp.]